MTGKSHAPPATRTCQKGTAPDDEIVCQARPRSPETGLLSRPVDILSQMANVWLDTENPAISTTSWPRVPAAWPLPNLMWKESLFVVKLDDLDGSNAAVPLQPIMQLMSATKRSLVILIHSTIHSLTCSIDLR